MHVTVKYYTVFSVAAGYRREETVFCPDNTNLVTLLEKLAARYGGRMEQLVSAMLGENHLAFWILVNGKRAGGSDFSLPLADGDTVILTTPLLVGG